MVSEHGWWFRIGHDMTAPKIFCALFVYILFAGLLLQKVVLPLTPWHAGDGLLEGGDWIRFHVSARQLAIEIEQNGWAHWALRPEGNAPIGITALLYAFSGIHAPWVVLPVNAALYAMAAVLLWLSVRRLSRNQLVAVAALLPMIFFPSTAMIWGQIHKDVWVLAGAMGIVWGVVRLGDDTPPSLKTCALLVAMGAGSALFIWMVRPYANLIFFVAGAIGVFVLAMLVRPRAVTWWLAAGCFLLAQAAFMFFTSAFTSAPTSGPCAIWEQQPRIPLVDNHLAGLACAREGFRLGFPRAGSNIDTEVGFRNARDIAAYVPRALQIGLLSPFPDMWMGEAKQPVGAAQRLLVIPEMVLYYLALIGCVLAVTQARYRESATLVAVISFSLFFVMIYALVVTNVGTLYRMRYPAMLTLCALGTWGWWLTARRYVRHE